MKRTILIIIAFIIGLLLVVTFGSAGIAAFVSDWLWIRSAGYSAVWWREGLVQFTAFFIPFIFCLTASYAWFYSFRKVRKERVLPVLFWLLSSSAGVYGFIHYQNLFLFFPQLATGYHDPLLKLDAYFYMATLPFLNIYLSILLAFSVVLFFLDLIFVRNGNGDSAIFHDGGFHLGFSRRLLLLITLLIGILLYITNSLQYLIRQPNARLGVDFTVFFGSFLGYTLWGAVALIFALVWFFRLKKGLLFKSILIHSAFLGVFYFLVSGIYPYLLNILYVVPNELMVERPFARYRMDATRQAFRLGFTPVYYPENQALSAEFSSAASFLRIWDSVPYRKVVDQLQSIKTYFDFSDVDTDVYPIAGNNAKPDLVQMMVAPRELNLRSLQPDALTWDNIHLRYTHGFGVAVSPAHLADESGSPLFWVSDLENNARYSNLAVTEPRIYFGELTSNYIIVKTSAEEFEYTSSTNRLTTRYRLDKGVRIGGFWSKLVYSILFHEKNIFLSRYLEKDSRILYYREIRERVRKIFPHFKYDTDAYMVIVNGKLYWILDAYTSSGDFPLSERFDTEFGKVNYIRNPVKVVIDAYSGDADFYLTDPGDPIARAYGQIFPSLYRKEIPPEFAAHFRYPYALLKVQSAVLCKYHVNNEDSFYNGDDTWEIPRQIYGQQATNFEPYYLIADFETNKTGTLTNCRPHLAAMQPFKPRGRENLASWVLAYYDNGLNLVLNYAKNTTSMPGPMQVNARMNQDDQLSSLFTLWGQKGSKIFRGSVRFIPLSGDILYIVPIFLESEQTGNPQLVKIVALFKGKIHIVKDYAELAGQI